MYVSAIRKKQRQGIIVAMVSCLLCYMTRLGGNRSATAKFSYMVLFFLLGVWYTRLNKSYL